MRYFLRRVWTTFVTYHCCTHLSSTVFMMEPKEDVKRTGNVMGVEKIFGCSWVALVCAYYTMVVEPDVRGLWCVIHTR